MLLIGVVVGSLVFWRRSSGNTGTVEPGRVYRCAQLDGAGFERLVRAKGIRTILNLRGPNPDQAWYREELAAALGLNVEHVDLPMASDQWLSHEQVQSLLEVLDGCEYPVLIHCEFGSERTGLVSALVKLLEPGGSVEEARDEFSLRYLFLPVKDGRVMLGHVEQYERWLKAHKVAHSAEQFRRWLTRDYRPGSPSREYWPCNPYPKLVVTGPTERRVERSAKACPKTVAAGAGDVERRAE